MIVSYFKLAVRLLIYNRFYSALNVLGLSVGFAVFFILWPVAQSELKSDQFIKDHERIFRVVVDWKWSDDGGKTWGQLICARFNSFLGSELASGFTAVEATTRLESLGVVRKLIIGRNTKDGPVVFEDNHSIRADSNFFSFFNLPLVEGNPATVLSAGSVALSQSQARTIFGDEPALNQVIYIDRVPHVVRGIFKDMPFNSHLQFSMVLSNVADLEVWNRDRQNAWASTYVKLGTSDRAAVESYLNERKLYFAAERLETYPENQLQFIVQPLRDVAFSDNFLDDTFKAKSRLMQILLAAVSIIVLVMAWVNYANLEISKAPSRFKEIAARKVAGAKLSDIFLQFIIQSLAINVVAVLMGITFVQVVRQPFELILDIHIPNWPPTIETLISYISVFVAGTVATAFYPAFAVVRYSARQLLTTKKGEGLRTIPSVLAVAQYVVAFVLITWMLVVYLELDLILNKDLGLKKDNMIAFTIPAPGDSTGTPQNIAAFIQRVKAEPGVAGAALSTIIPGDRGPNMNFKRSHKSGARGHDGTAVDESFVPLYHIKLLKGRNFVSNDRDSIVMMSEIAVNRLGFPSPDDAVGAKVFGLWGTEWREFEIVGVFADFREMPYFYSASNSESFTEAGFFFLYAKANHFRHVSIEVNMANLPATIDRLEAIYRETFPNNPASWTFVDENVNKHYSDQKVIRNQIIFFTVIAIGIACLGLLGMISNKVIEKTKEIGVRKILGAGPANILSVLLGSTGRQAIIAVIIAFPVSRYLCAEYLVIFTERISIQWWHYLFPVLFLSTIMTATITSRLWKAMRSNPVEALRHE